jgi:inorganic pyrophosphatase
MIALDKLEAFERDELIVIIETPKGSQNKYEYQPQLEGFVLAGVLPAGAVFPFDFGFVPSTIGEDGDPLDVLLLMDAAAFTGCIVYARLIGVIEAEQTENGKTVRNDRLIAVAAKSITHRSLKDISDVSGDLLAQIEYFFTSYNTAKGKTFEPKGRSGRERALTLVRAGIESAKKE